ncbi:hypothetical protein KFU94_00680 [Chloroflexi bacterium TSY]|nr:hypothetical protein [Chloroflexi bacterium TSY]
MEQIRVGQFIDYEIGGGTQIINFPETTADDVLLVAGSAHGPSGSALVPPPQAEPVPSPQPAPARHPPGTAPAPAADPPLEPVETDPTIRELAVQAALAEGWGTNEIIRNIYQITTKGRPWTRANQDLQRIKEKLVLQEFRG